MYQISDARLFLRPMGAAAIDFKIGKQTKLFPDWMPGIVELELDIQSLERHSQPAVTGIAGDWPAFGWLDKRIDIAERSRLRLLLERLLQLGNRIRGFSFQNIGDAWAQLHADEIQTSAKSKHRWGQPHEVTLSETFCLALFERAIIDGLCRLSNQPFAQWCSSPENQEAEHTVHGLNFQANGSDFQPVEKIGVRHTIGLGDSLFKKDSPYSLEAAIEKYGLSFFKVKVSGHLQEDLQRLRKIWPLIKSVAPTVTIDGNEAFADVQTVYQFVVSMQRELPDLFSTVKFLEQPLSRFDTFAKETQPELRSLSRLLPLVIDEADAEADAFKKAIALGYAGVSHKNCKGIVKSFRNLNLIGSQPQRRLFLTGEDLTNVPIIPLHQDLVVASVLGLRHVERNGHHYFPGLTHLPDTYVQQMLLDYPNLYVPMTKDNRQSACLRIVNGTIDVSDLNKSPGLGIKSPPPNDGRGLIADYLAGKVL